MNERETTIFLYDIRSGDPETWTGRSRRHLPISNTGSTSIGSAWPAPDPAAIPPSVASVRLSSVTGRRGGFTRPPAAKSFLFGPTNRSAGDLWKPPGRSERNPVRTASRYGSRNDPGHRYSLIPAIPARPTTGSESGNAKVRRLAPSGRPRGSTRSGLTWPRPDSHSLSVLPRMSEERADSERW